MNITWVGSGRGRRCQVKFLSVACLVFAGCVQTKAVDLTGKDCPCAEGWSCDTAQSPPVCVRGGSGARAVPRDGSAPAPRNDGGPPPVPGLDGGPAPTGLLWFEAEASVAAPMEVQSDGEASGGSFAITPAASAALNDDPAGAGGTVTVQFDVAVAGTYVVWGRIRAPTDSQDSYWVSMDGGVATLWNELTFVGTAGQWEWDTVHDTPGAVDPLTYDLGVGSHEVTFTHREPDAALDRVLITSDMAYVPSGQGE